MEDVIVWKHILAALIYSLLGVFVLISSFLIVERITPEHSWNEIIQNKNQALAIVLGSFILAMGIIIASAIHG